MITGVNGKGRDRARQKSDQKGKVNDYWDSFLMKLVFMNRIIVVRYRVTSLIHVHHCPPLEACLVHKFVALFQAQGQKQV
jgi:hypothetical protein